MSDIRPVSPRVMLAMAITAVLGAGAGYILGYAMHSTTVPDLKIISNAIRTASHGELAPVRILPVPPGANIPSGVMPIQVSVSAIQGLADGNKSALVWAVYRNGKFVFFPGSAFDAKGVNLAIPLMRAMELAKTGTTTDARTAPATASPSQSVTMATNAQGFIWAAPGQQDARPNVILFADPNCIFCHREFDQLKPLVDAGKAVVKVVPVAFLKASSMGKAEAILNGGVAAFLGNEASFDSSTEEGGISPMDVPNLAQDIQSNTRLLSELEDGRVATPFMLIRQGNSGHEENWQPRMGLVSGPELSAMLGMG